MRVQALTLATERRRSRTYPATGYAASPVLKTTKHPSELQAFRCETAVRAPVLAPEVDSCCNDRVNRRRRQVPARGKRSPDAREEGSTVLTCGLPVGVESRDHARNTTCDGARPRGAVKEKATGAALRAGVDFEGEVPLAGDSDGCERESAATH